MYDEISCLTLVECLHLPYAISGLHAVSFLLSAEMDRSSSACSCPQSARLCGEWVTVSGRKGALSVWVSHEPRDKLGFFLTNARFLRPVHFLLFHEVKHYIRQKLNQPTKVLNADLLLCGCLFHSLLIRKAHPSHEGSKQGVTFHFRNLMKCKMMIWL